VGTRITGAQVLNFRVHAQQLDRTAGDPDDTAVLDIGVQDTGPDGGLWALAMRGWEVSSRSGPDVDLATVWTIRGAPHLYRRKDLPAVAAAVAPFSDADASKRIYDAAKPLKAAKIGSLEALDAVAAAMRSIVVRPTVKGEVSKQLTSLLDKPYLRYCRPCAATHLYEMPFRLAALRAGLELQPGTSPPVLQRIARFRVAAKVPERLDVVRAYLRLLGPATPKHVADYLDAPVKDVKDRWPADAVAISVDGESRWALLDDVEQLGDARSAVTRLLGPFDLFLQARDRDLLVHDATKVKALWPVLGRPGAVLRNGQIAGTWRPRQAAGKLTLAVDLWKPPSTTVRRDIAAQAERLAEHRRVRLSGVELAT
jgi:hypothetical protein